MTTKINPTKANTTDHLSGKTITAVTVDFAVNGTDFSSTEMGPFAPAESRRVVFKLTAIEMILIQSRDNCYK